jgi:hypothetical protein
MFRAPLCPSSGARDYTTDYHMRRLTPWLLVVGGQVQGGWLSVRAEDCLQQTSPSASKLPTGIILGCIMQQTVNTV